MRLAKARRKIAENSESRPPMPISSNLKFGARMAFWGRLGPLSADVRTLCELNSPLGRVLELDPACWVFDPDDFGTLHDYRRLTFDPIERGRVSDCGFEFVAPVIEDQGLEWRQGQGRECLEMSSVRIDVDWSPKLTFTNAAPMSSVSKRSLVSFLFRRNATWFLSDRMLSKAHLQLYRACPVASSRHKGLAVHLLAYS